MTNNNNKARILNLFADNVQGEITASTLREFIETIFDDAQIVINKFNSLQAFEDALVEDRADIYEGSMVAIINAPPEENGLYISTMNQPSTRDFLKQISNNSKLSESSVTRNDYIAQEGPFQFTANYTGTLIEVFVEGAKIPHSKVLLNSTPTTNGTIVILTEPLAQGQEVEISATLIVN